MFTTSQRSSRTALLPVLVVLYLFSAKGQTVASTDTNHTTSSPAETNSSLSTHLNSSMVMKTHRPCGKDNKDFCANGGQCIYYQDRNEPSCRCQFPFEGDRCIKPSFSQKSNESEQLVGIIVGVVMTIFALVIILYCCFVKRCVKSAPLKTSSPETQV